MNESLSEYKCFLVTRKTNRLDMMRAWINSFESIRSYTRIKTSNNKVKNKSRCSTVSQGKYQYNSSCLRIVLQIGILSR
jgi:hypothetical protein